MRKLLDCDYHRNYIDLHVHSSASDGTSSPSEILLEASRIGLKAIAITDHDTLEGSKAAFESGIPGGLNFISGVELSVSPPPGFCINKSIHILGYGIRIDNPELNSCLESLRQSRRNRTKRLLDKLNDLGITICEEEVLNEATGSVVGRPHFANVMVKRGFVSSPGEAFNRFLANGKPAYIKKRIMNIGDMLALIKSAGGIPILAHPYSIGIKNHDIFKKFVMELKTMGLMGIEAIYPEHSKDISSFYFKLAYKHGLLVTGGTDFHGDNTPGLSLGFGRGDFSVPFTLYKDLLKSVDKGL